MNFELLLPVDPTGSASQGIFSAAFLPVEKFPMPLGSRMALVQRIEKWIETLQGVAAWKSLTFLEMSKLPLDKGGPKVSANGRLWIPSTGLGVFPHQPPPRLWSAADFLERDFGTPLPTLINTVFMVRNSERAARDAFRTMLGGGSVTYLLTEDIDQTLALGEQELLPNIQEEALRGHPFYMPLLTVAAVRLADAQLLQSWLGPAKVYLRESTEDGGILVVCSKQKALEPLLQPALQL